jgi:hypothetical protein
VKFLNAEPQVFRLESQSRHRTGNTYSVAISHLEQTSAKDFDVGVLLFTRRRAGTAHANIAVWFWNKSFAKHLNAEALAFTIAQKSRQEQHPRSR